MLTSAIVILAIVVITWLISLALRDASVIDPVWPLGFVAVAITAFVAGDGDEGRRLLILVLVGLWGLRLSGYLMWRNAGKGEDFRYAAMREKRGPSFWIISLVTIFVLQGVLMWVVSLPVQLAAVPDRGLGWLAAAGGAAWAIGFAFESIGDWQLARFKADPSNTGKVLDSGLWRYTRHPNYFGDFCIWWGLYLVAVAGGGWWAVAGPLLMSVLLMRVSGVTLLEKDISERRPAYRDYVQRTNAFFPGPPRPPQR
jgi:steroid 5-alpha reductase family enzyme